MIKFKWPLCWRRRLEDAFAAWCELHSDFTKTTGKLAEAKAGWNAAIEEAKNVQRELETVKGALLQAEAQAKKYADLYHTILSNRIGVHHSQVFVGETKFSVSELDFSTTYYKVSIPQMTLVQAVSLCELARWGKQIPDFAYGWIKAVGKKIAAEIEAQLVREMNL